MKVPVEIMYEFKLVQLRSIFDACYARTKTDWLDESKTTQISGLLKYTMQLLSIEKEPCTIIESRDDSRGTTAYL